MVGVNKMEITKDNIYNIEWEKVTIDDIRAIKDEHLRDLARELRVKWLVQERENDIKRFNEEEK